MEQVLDVASVRRRALLGYLGAAAAAALTGCGATVGSGAEQVVEAEPLSTSPTSATSPTPTPVPTAVPAPTPTKRIFVPDYVLPPIVNGLAPVISRIPTAHPIVFLTIDDGLTRTPEMVRLMRAYNYPASLFLTQSTVSADPAFFTQFAAQGSLVENHTVNHNINMIRTMGYQQQLAEISGMQDFATAQYGRTPTLFRPPGGAYSGAMQQAVAAAGLRAIITWEAKANAGRMDYQVGNALRPGDIVLMHFRPEFAADLEAFRAAQLAAGLEVVLLEEFLGVV